MKTRFDIEINWKTIITVVAVIMAAAAVIIVPKLLETEEGPKEITAADIAVQAAERFFTLEYTGREKWAESICEISTDGGCRYNKEVLGPALFEIFERNQTVSKTTVSSVELIKVVEEDFTGRPLYLYKATIELSELWPGFNPDALTNPHLMIVEIEGEWKFDKLLNDVEIHRLYESLETEGNQDE